MRTVLIALLASLALPAAAEARPQTADKLARAKDRAKAATERRAAKATRVRERCEVALYEACLLRVGDDASSCEAVADGGAVDYSVCSTTEALPQRSFTDREWLNVCIHERTGPTGGISVAEATAVCASELARRRR